MFLFFLPIALSQLLYVLVLTTAICCHFLHELNHRILILTAGHGEVRLSNVLPLLNGQGLDSRLDLYVFDKQTIREGETLRFEIKLPILLSRRTSHAPIKITICWYDPPAPLGSSRALLMHDLDLVVLAPDGALHWGNANKGQDLQSSEDGTKGAQRSAGDPSGANSSFPGWAWADDVNPNEQVYIQVFLRQSLFIVLY